MVLLIISILSINAIPKFSSTSIFSVNAYYLEVINSLKYAQKVAVASGCDVEASITPSALVLKLRANCDSGNFTQDLIDPSNNRIGFIKTIPNGVTINASNFPVHFNALGQTLDVNNNKINANLQIGANRINIVGETGFVYES